MTTRTLTRRAAPAGKNRARVGRQDSSGTAGNLNGGTLTGLGTLLRFMLRRDRIRFPAWSLGLAVMTAYFANAIGLVLDSSSLASMAVFAQNPVMGLISGPGYGFDEITLPIFIVGVYGVFLMLGTGIMGITTISRHTRAEEQSGRAELIRAGVLGRHAPLAAALLLAGLLSVCTGLLMSLALFFSESAPEPYFACLLFGLSVGSVGVVFAAIAAVTLQLSSVARAGSGIAGALLALSFIVRGLGDMSAVAGGELDGLSWFSPLGWAQQTAPFVLDRWWPLLLSLGLAVILVALAVALQSRRDLAAGLLPDRLGARRASRLLSTPVGLVLRLQRGSLLWWTVGVLLMGLTFGSFAGAMRDSAEGMPDQILQLFGGAGGIVDGYLGYMGLYFAMIVTVHGILAVAALRGEESGTHAEAVLATGLSRWRWLGSWMLVTLVCDAWLLFIAGLGEGFGAALSLDDSSVLWPSIVGHSAQIPAVWALVAFAFALYGFLPRLVGLSWIVYGYSAVVALFGPLMKLTESGLDTSVFHLIGQYPGGDIAAEAVFGLVGASAVLVVLALVTFRRRDLRAG